MQTPFFRPSPSIVAQVARLPTMPIDELRALWLEFYNIPAPTYRRAFLEKRLAYRLQEQEFRQQHTDILNTNQQKIQAITQSQQQTPNKKKRQQLPTGTLLTRVYQGRECRVTVLPEGQFEFEGRPYKSLSVIAREITGTRWSGPLFFGLRTTSSKPTKRK